MDVNLLINMDILF